MNNFNSEILTAEESFWVMFYFLDEHYKLSDGKFELSDVLSASEPCKIKNSEEIVPCDNSMIAFWNEAINKYRENGIPDLKTLKK